MKKVKLIIGKIDSGKSTIAKEIVSSIKDEEKVFIIDRHLDSYFWASQCTEKTRAIVIDEFNPKRDLAGFILTHLNGVQVKQPCKETFFISPEIIIVCSEDYSKEQILDMGSSIVRRIEIIETLS